MNIALAILIAVLLLWMFYKLLSYSGKDEYNRDTSHYNRNAEDYDTGKNEKNSSKKSLFSSLQRKESRGETKKQNLFVRLFSSPLPFEEEAISWCANFLAIEKSILVSILKNVPACYTHFKVGKRSGGCRIISAPNIVLLNIQKTIYRRALLPVNVHPASTGFRPNISVVDNAKAHLGKTQIVKIDIVDFFGSIKKPRVINTFEKIGYPSNISKVLSELCLLGGELPQGAPTSPPLSNIVVYAMDVKIAFIAQKYGLTYTRYVDDLTFSGENIPFETLLSEVRDILAEDRLSIQRKKTRFLTKKKRKIITGISVSSGEKLMIPKSKKREIRKNVYYILTKGLAEHQRFIGSADPSYLKRLIGYLNFWLMVEPDNEYVKKSLAALRKL